MAARTLPAHSTRPAFRDTPIDIVIDVRSRLEFWLGHLAGAICIPVDAIAAQLPKHPDIGPDMRILVYCASGARSAAAAVQLRSLGFHAVTDAGAMATATLGYQP